MTYPYDGIRSSFEYYNNYIDYLKQENKLLKEQNKEYLLLIMKCLERGFDPFEQLKFVEEEKTKKLVIK